MRVESPSILDISNTFYIGTCRKSSFHTQKPAEAIMVQGLKLSFQINTGIQLIDITCWNYQQSEDICNKTQLIWHQTFRETKHNLCDCATETLRRNTLHTQLIEALYICLQGAQFVFQQFPAFQTFRETYLIAQFFGFFPIVSHL